MDYQKVTHTRHKKGFTDIKAIMIPVTIAGVALGIGLNYIYKQKSSAGAFANSDKKDLKKLKAAGSFDPSSSLLRLKDHMKSTQEKNVFLQEKNELLASLVASKEKELTRLASEQASLKADFETKSGNLYAQLAKKDSEIAALNSSKQNLETQIKDLNDRISVLFNSQGTFQSQLSQLQQEKASLMAEADKTKGDLKKETSINETLNATLSGLTESLNKKEQERLALAKALEELQAAKGSADAERNALKVAGMDNEKQAAALNLRIKELQSLYEEAKSSVLEATNLVTKKNSAIEVAQNEIANVRAGLDKVTKEKEALLSSLDDKEKSLAELKSKLSAREDRVRELEKTLAETMDRFAQVEQNLGSSLGEQEKSVYELRGELDNKETLVTDLQREAAHTRERLSQLDEQLNDQAALNDSLKTTLRDLTAECELLRQEKESRGKSIRDYLDDFVD